MLIVPRDWTAIAIIAEANHLSRQALASARAPVHLLARGKSDGKAYAPTSSCTFHHLPTRLEVLERGSG